MRLLMRLNIAAIGFGSSFISRSRSARCFFQLFLLPLHLFVEFSEARLHVFAQLFDFRRPFLQFFLGRLETFHLFEYLRLERGNLFARGIGFANRGRVLVRLLDGLQVSFSTLKPLPLVEDFRFHSRPLVKRCFFLLFEGPNFKSALIELSFDLGAPFRNALDFSL